MAGEAGEAGTALFVEIAKKAIRPTIDATVLHFGYLVSYKSNIDNLKQKVEELKSTRLDAENFLGSFGDNNEEATNTCTDWLVKFKAAEDVANSIKKDTDNLKTKCWCSNPIMRYRLSKNAVKEAEEIQQLQIQGRAYVPFRKPALPPSKLSGALANDGSKGFESRAKIMDEIMEAIKDDKISIIGVCGLGGVGKTKLMHELRERANTNALFHEVAMATVSQNQDLSIIRFKLAEMLGLTRAMDGKNEIATADELHKRLSGKDKRTLVILDDIWIDINLEELGIPVGNDQTHCKVVLTSRKFGICTQMKAQKIIPVAIMPPGEAWYLFRKTTGDCVESDDLKKIAKEVADECGGLPIALVTLAKALSNKKIGIWRDALKQLRERSVTRIPEMDKKVYSSIKMSYDFLASELPEARPLLLLCCQHKEDAEIPVEKLARYCLTLRLFKNVDTVEDARNSVTSLVEHLKSCFLLEAIDIDDDDKNWRLERVKMHDIVRDVGMSIISSAKEERAGVYMQIVEQATNEGYELGTSEADYQKLKILVHSRVDGGLLKKSFLSQMEQLRVLEYSPDDWHLQLPAVEVLTNLRMLSIERAKLNEDSWSKIVRLKKLEILSLLNCFKIGPLPHQIKQLSHLKLLDLRSRSDRYRPIPRGILPELKMLEMLYLGRYYFSGTPEDGEEVNEGESYGCIAELDMLPNLTALQVQLLNPMQLFDLHLCFEKLERFSFGTVRRLELLFFRAVSPLIWRTLELEDLSMELILRDKIQLIVKRTEKLSLRQIDWTDSLIIENLMSLRRLELNDCPHLEYLVGASSVGVFTNLKKMTLMCMNSLTALCQNGNLPRGTFGKLRKLKLSGLPKIRHLWVGPTDPLCLVNLIEVYVHNCGALECIFPHSAAKCLVQLQELRVDKCGMLEGIVSKGEGTATGGGGEITEGPTDLILHFPKLREVTFLMSESLRGFYNQYDDNSRIQPLMSPLVMLPSMEFLRVYGLDQLKQIVGCGIIDDPKFIASDWLQNLQRIDVTSCTLLESVFDFEGELFMAENGHVVTLDKLQQIDLRNLPNLTRIFHCRHQDISIPQLQAIDVHDCGKLENLVASDLIKLLQSLKRVKLENCETIKAVFDFAGLEVTSEDEHVMLSELQDIELDNLPKLEHICRLTPNEIHIFQNLRTLSVDNCASLGYLLSSSMAQMLVNLELLSIQDCNSMKEGIKMSKEYNTKKIVFCSLSTISLVRLEKLSSFCSSDQQEFEFPSLEKVSIISCPKIKTFCYGGLKAEKLHGVEFGSGKTVWKSDLNQTIQLYNECNVNKNRVNPMISDQKEDGAQDEYVQCKNERTSSKPMRVLVTPLTVSSRCASLTPLLVSSSSSLCDYNKAFAYSSSPGLVVPVPSASVQQFFPSSDLKEIESAASAVDDHSESNDAGDVLIVDKEKESPVHSSDTSMKTEAEKTQFDSLSIPDYHKKSKVLVQGVYVEANMKTTFEEILTENPNFLSPLRVKTAMLKTALVETAIHTLQILGQDGRLSSSEQLVYVRDSLDDMAANGLDVGWLERDYQRASILIDEQKAVLVEAKLVRLEREGIEDEVAFQMAKEKMEASMALRDACKAELDSLMQGLETRNKLLGGGVDSQTTISESINE